MKRALCLFALISGFMFTNVSTTYGGESIRREGMRSSATRTKESTERVRDTRHERNGERARTLHHTIAKTAKVIAGTCLAVQTFQTAFTAFNGSCTNVDEQEATRSFAYSLGSAVGAGAFYLFDKYATCLFLNSAFDQLADLASSTQPEEDE